MINWTDQVMAGALASGAGAPSGDPGPQWALWLDESTGNIYTHVGGGTWVKVGAPPGSIDPSTLVAHRVGLTAIDNPNYPTIWVPNTGAYNNAKVAVFGATWGPTDVDQVSTWRLWRRSLGAPPERGGSFSVTPLAKFTATLTDQGTVTYAVAGDSVTDDGQTDFDLVRPASAADPSTHIFTAEPATTSDIAVFGWAGFGGIPPALLIQQSPFPGAGVGWVGGFTPDNVTPGDDQILTYSVRLANITFTPPTFTGLGGADFALTLEALDGVGQSVLYAGVVLF